MEFPSSTTSVETNLWQVDGTLTLKKTLRYTPASLEVLEFEAQHQSKQLYSAEQHQQINFLVSAIAFGKQALFVNAMPLSTTMQLQGYLAPRSARSSSLWLHVTQISIQKNS